MSCVGACARLASPVLRKGTGLGAVTTQVWWYYYIPVVRLTTQLTQ